MACLTYGDIKKETEVSYSKLMKECNVFFAFSNEQFESNKTALKDNEKYVRIVGGGYLPSGFLSLWNKQIKFISDTEDQKIKDNNLQDDEILYHLYNHECFYTYEIDDVIDLLGGKYSDAKIWEVFNNNKENQ